MSETAAKLARKGSREQRSNQVRLKLRYISVASVAKIAFLLGLTIGIVGFIVTMVAYAILSATGALAGLDTLLGSAVGSSSASLTSILTPGVVLGAALVFSFLDIVVVTLGGIIGAALYNTSTRMTEGLFVGFTNR